MKLFYMLIVLLGFNCVAQNIQTKVLKPGDADFVDISENYNLEGITKQLISVQVKNSGNYAWFFNEKPFMNGTLDASYEESVTSVYAYLMIEDHGGYLQKVRFQDFANGVYLPKFIYEYCLVDDADKDGFPEFYLTYFGMSDGLDSKPLKVIVYTRNKGEKEFTKSKITEFYPIEEVDYVIESDANFKLLKTSIQKRASKILADIKKKNVLKWE